MIMKIYRNMKYLRRHAYHKNSNFCLYIFGVIPLRNLTIVVSCPLYKSKPNQDIFMKLYRNVQHQKIMRWHAKHKKRNFYVYFLELFFFEIVSCSLYNLKNIQGISWNFIEMWSIIRRRADHKPTFENANFRYFALGVNLKTILI